jgi:hypothetical protein
MFYDFIRTYVPYIDLPETEVSLMDDYKIIAVDFDGTLCFSNWPALGEPNVALIEYLKDWKKCGNKLILWTCRAGDALDMAVSWCYEQELVFDAINDNLPEIVEKYGNNSRKITCDYYIDDRARLPESVCV